MGIGYEKGEVKKSVRGWEEMGGDGEGHRQTVPTYRTETGIKGLALKRSDVLWEINEPSARKPRTDLCLGEHVRRGYNKQAMVYRGAPYNCNRLSRL